MKRTITLRIVEGDALQYEADVLALKHAQVPHGLDRAVCERISTGRVPLKLPSIGQFAFFDTRGTLGAKSALFVGVDSLRSFDYAAIRKFGQRVLALLAAEAPNTRRIAITIHGPGYGLDETESFTSELSGIVEGINSGEFPAALEAISFVERDKERAQRLSDVLRQLIPQQVLTLDVRSQSATLSDSARSALRSAGDASEIKPHAFVAMPFAPEMDDLFHYGIQGAVNAAGLLCERADLSQFTGDVVDWVKGRISTATLVVADLSSANPNVYLEVGFAWGRNVPTVLIVRDAADLKFDVRGQRTIVYRSIQHLEETLARELAGVLRLSH